MGETNSGSDIVADSQTSFIIALPWQNASGPVAGSYAQIFRMGAWDTTIENGIVDSSGNKIYAKAGTNSEYTGDDPLQDKGVLVYSADQVTIYSPQIRTVGATSSSSWSSENMTVTTDGDKVVAYSFSGPLGFAANYQNIDSISITQGATATFIGGSAMTVWSGNDASTGAGGLLWSNFGLTQNIFDGQVVNLNGTDISVQGRGGTSLSSNVMTLATEWITIASVPPTGIVSGAMKAADVLGTISRMGGILVAGVMPVVDNIVAGVTTSNLSSGEKDIQAKAKAEFDIAGVLAGLVVVVQCIASLSGIVLAAAGSGLAKLTPGGSMTLSPVSATLASGMASKVEVTDLTVSIDTGAVDIQAATTITLQAGASSILVTDDSIMLMGGTGQILLSPAGVRIAGPTQNLTA